ncbi:MAG TPA: alcohol dehydrogenase, partial [Desulfosarcina sp.]|nr:alcohol dehydrogenase [Desulfosarcina sp.]
MFRNFKMVSKVVFGRGCFGQLGDILAQQRSSSKAVMVFLVDDVFATGPLQGRLPVESDDLLIWVNVDDEPKTAYVDQLTTQVKKHMVGKFDRHPSGVVGIGGG